MLNISVTQFWGYFTGTHISCTLCVSHCTSSGLRSQVSSSRSRVCFQSLKAIVTPECLLVLDFRGFGLDKWLVLELGPQLAGEGTLVTYSLPFEFRALEALLQHRVG